MDAADGNILQDMDIESIIQCPVCFEIPPKIIYMCKIGHHICERCRLSLTTCPTCNSAITATRNFLGESLTQLSGVQYNQFLKYDPFLLKHPVCVQQGSGKDNGNEDKNLNDAINTTVLQSSTSIPVSSNDDPLSRLSIPGGTYKCLLESCPQSNGMGVGNMIAHLGTRHAHIFDKFKNTTATFKNKFENFCFRIGASKYHRAIHVSNMGLFFLMLECVHGSYLNCWISTPAQSKRTNDFLCELVFCKEGSHKRWMFRNKVASNLLEKRRVLDTGRVFIIPPEDHQLKNGDFFSLDVKIVYKPNEPTLEPNESTLEPNESTLEPNETMLNDILD